MGDTYDKNKTKVQIINDVFSLWNNNHLPFTSIYFLDDKNKHIIIKTITDIEQYAKTKKLQIALSILSDAKPLAWKLRGYSFTDIENSIDVYGKGTTNVKTNSKMGTIKSEHLHANKSLAVLIDKLFEDKKNEGIVKAEFEYEVPNMEHVQTKSFVLDSNTRLSTLYPNYVPDYHQVYISLSETGHNNGNPCIKQFSTLEKSAYDLDKLKFYNDVCEVKDNKITTKYPRQYANIPRNMTIPKNVLTPMPGGRSKSATTTQKIVVLGRERVLTKKGRSWVLRYKGKDITLTEARAEEKRIAKEKRDKARAQETKKTSKKTNKK
jgi:hypothetical protein